MTATQDSTSWEIAIVKERFGMELEEKNCCLGCRFRVTSKDRLDGRKNERIVYIPVSVKEIPNWVRKEPSENSIENFVVKRSSDKRFFSDDAS